MLSAKPVLLIILDGWGMPEGGAGDALCAASLPNFRRLWAEYPHTSLACSGLDVGLPAGQMGNSEVGHMTIGAGRVIYQDYTRINLDIENGGFFLNPALIAAMQAAKQGDSALHLLGLTSDGGVHSHMGHIFALLDMAKRQGLKRVYLHCFTDGRDTAPDVADRYLGQLAQYCRDNGVGEIASVSGRFYAMDRDQRWPRLERAYRALVYGEGPVARDAVQAARESLARGVNDEFIEPTVIVDHNGRPVGRIRDDDSLIFFNFRADRARQLSHALIDRDFSAFERGPGAPRLANFTAMTEYQQDLAVSGIAYPPEEIKRTLGQVAAAHGLRQLRIAETEKYAHVTFFFNGGQENPAPGEDRLLIASPQVKTYDLQPEMSAVEVTDAVVERIANGGYDLIILNYANPDMVGHTGQFSAAVQAVETVDACLGRVERAVRAAGGIFCVTADHGNVEHMLEQGQPMTAHSLGRVPFILAADNYRGRQLREDGGLRDIAPTLLQLLGLDAPPEMSGSPLLMGAGAVAKAGQ